MSAAKNRGGKSRAHNPVVHELLVIDLSSAANSICSHHQYRCRLLLLTMKISALLALILIGVFANVTAFLVVSMKSAMNPSLTTTTTSRNSLRPFYSDPNIQRDKSHVLTNMKGNLYLNTTKFVLHTKNGMVYKATPSSEQREPRVQALYFSAQQVDDMLGDNSSLGDMVDSGAILAWLGKYKESDYWVLYVDELNTCSDAQKPLREFGDRLESVTDAGILATANGLVEFHKSHSFCSQCGSRSIIDKAGACRRCSKCKKSTYPRIDLASIMLITSSCGSTCLVGTKESMAQGSIFHSCRICRELVRRLKIVVYEKRLKRVVLSWIHHPSVYGKSAVAVSEVTHGWLSSQSTRGWSPNDSSGY